LARTLRSERQPDQRLMRRLVRGWGNEAWSADAPLLSAALEWLPQTTGSIVECGSGLSTLVLATAASLAGRCIHSLEHDAGWAARIERELPARLRPSLELNVTPLKSYGDFDWYSLENLALPASVGFVVCDGPPGGTRGGRYGLGPILQPRLAPGCVVLLDDTQRADEHEIVGRWCNELPASVVHEGATYSVLSIGTHKRLGTRIADSTRARA
jgi:hypothetical protein